MIKAIALPVVLFSAISPAFSLSNHGQTQSTEGLLNENKAYEVAIFGDIFGEGALKKDCLELWEGYSEYASIVQRKCNKASKEIEFAKKEYPRFLSITKSLKSSVDSGDKVISNFIRLQSLKQSCLDKTAIRAAKTVRYWGTNEVGSTPDVKNKTISSLSRLNASEYGIILQACKENSWLDSRLISIKVGLNRQIKKLISDSSKIPPICSTQNANNAKESIDVKYVEDIKSKVNEYEESIKDLNTFDTVSASANSVSPADSEDTEISTVDIYDARESLKMKIKACMNTFNVAKKFLSDNQKRQNAIKRQRRQRAAEAQKKKNFENAIDSVDLE